MFTFRLLCMQHSHAIRFVLFSIITFGSCRCFPAGLWSASHECKCADQTVFFFYSSIFCYSFDPFGMLSSSQNANKKKIWINKAETNGIKMCVRSINRTSIRDFAPSKNHIFFFVCERCVTVTLSKPSGISFFFYRFLFFAFLVFLYFKFAPLATHGQRSNGHHRQVGSIRLRSFVRVSFFSKIDSDFLRFPSRFAVVYAHILRLDHCSSAQSA